MHYKQSWIYIITNKNNSVLYIGVTSNLNKRIYQHRNKLIKGFSSKYNLKKLIYYELYGDINIAISREKQLKGWNRSWKFELIKKVNPDFKDLFDESNNEIQYLPEID